MQRIKHSKSGHTNIQATRNFVCSAALQNVGEGSTDVVEQATSPQPQVKETACIAYLKYNRRMLFCSSQQNIDTALLIPELWSSLRDTLNCFLIFPRRHIAS